MKNVFGIAILISLVGCGKDRIKEVKGLDGNDGVSCYAESRQTGNYIVCGDSEFRVADGIDGQDGQDGKDGVDGVDGTDGIDGQDGKDGIDGQDGADGSDGADGQDGQDGSFDGYLEYVEVCPDVSGNLIETLLYLDGEYLAFLSEPNHKKQRLVILDDGTYKTTDGRNVYFHISGDDLICL